MYESSISQYFTEKGIKQGIKQGVEQGLRHSIQEALALRFDPGVAQSLVARLAAIDEAQRLKELHRAAIQVPNLEAFSSLLDADE